MSTPIGHSEVSESLLFYFHCSVNRLNTDRFPPQNPPLPQAVSNLLDGSLRPSNSRQASGENFRIRKDTM